MVEHSSAFILEKWLISISILGIFFYFVEAGQV